MDAAIRVPMVASAVLALALLTSGVAACARIEIRPERNADEAGLRFYRPKPYLWVSVTDKGSCEAKIIYLPDTSTTWIIQPHAGIGRLEFKPTLSDGWNLTAFDATVDSKTAETLGAIGGLVEKAGGVALQSFDGSVSITPGLYALGFDEAGEIGGIEPVLRFSGPDGQQIACGAPSSGSKRMVKP